MANEPSMIWEDEEYVYIPEVLFEHLPLEYREAAEARRQQGSDMLQIADQDIRSLIRLANAIPTTSSLRYIFYRLRNTKFDMSTEAFLEHEILTTAFVVTYSRLFVSGSGSSGVSRDQLPARLRGVHDDIIDIRHKRYAHTDSHESMGSGLQIDFDDDGFRINLQMSMGMYIGGRNEWEELVTFLDGLMHDRLQRIIRRLKDKTGYDWTFPTGPAPGWVG